MTATAPATTREEHADRVTNASLNRLAEKLRLLARAAVDDGYPVLYTTALQRHLLARAVEGIGHADRLRGEAPPRAERVLIVRWPR